MIPLPQFDLHYADGVALIDLAEHLDLDGARHATGLRHAALIDKLTRAVDDIERLKAGWRPAPEQLINAPLLARWGFSGGEVPGTTTLRGIVTGHPKLADGTRCQTSILLAIDIRNWTWARTVSRFYRLTSEQN